jgi:copper oxidase (laccase) domain-containing protein
MTEPFAIFRPYGDRVRVRLYGKSDAVYSAHDVTVKEGQLLAADPQQTHGSLTTRVFGAGTVPDADGLVTDVRGLSLSCRSADCQTFAVYDPVHGAGGVLHAGWHGLVKGAIPAFVDVMRREWKSDPADFLIGVGPSLCWDCGEFTEPARELPTIDPRFFRQRLVNLRGIADDQWTSIGVRPDNIERHPDCSKCEGVHWWSLRGGDREEMMKGARNVLTFSLK